ncbi:MAG: nuclear transport factor 2 family protein [Nitrospinaceae bacterium]
MFKFIARIALAAVMIFPLTGLENASAADTDELTTILKKVDSLVCTQPEKITQFYAPKLVIMADDKRALLENRITGYRQMMSDFREMNCQTQRQVLAGRVGKVLGYILADEISSITSKSTDTDERQHSVCNYVFKKDGGSWKIVLEQCSSLPDYTITPGDDALYYFHNPVY